MTVCLALRQSQPEEYFHGYHLVFIHQHNFISVNISMTIMMHMVVILFILILFSECSGLVLGREIHVRGKQTHSLQTTGYLSNKKKSTMHMRGGEISLISSSLKGIEHSTLMRGFAGIVTSVVDPAISGGLLSGGLHAITGPDHLAALIAPSFGQSWYNGVKIGVIWGVGHGISALALGMTAFFLKGQFTGRFAIVEQVAGAAESVVGLSILVIGMLGIKESLEASSAQSHSSNSLYKEENHISQILENNRENMIIDSNTENVRENVVMGSKLRTYRAIFANGLLHGFSWDGAPSLAPAIAMSSWPAALTYLLSYCAGTILTMSAAAGTVGELSRRVGLAGSSSSNPRLPHILSLVSSVLAVLIGAYLFSRSINLL